MEMFRSENETLGIQIDVRDVMRQVYIWMTGGLLITAIVAFGVAQSGLWRAMLKPIVWIVTFIVQIGLVIFLSARIHKISPTTAGWLFALYSAAVGFSLSVLFLAFTSAAEIAPYTIGELGYALIATVAMFGAMSVVGYTTNVDLSKFGSILMMGLFGLIVAMVVNMFVASSTLYWIVSIAGVVIFTALTAYDTQKIKHMAGQAQMLGATDASVAVRRVAIIGALELYLDFINLFLFLLRLIGGGRD